MMNLISSPYLSDEGLVPIVESGASLDLIKRRLKDVKTTPCLTSELCFSMSIKNMDSF